MNNTLITQPSTAAGNIDSKIVEGNISSQEVSRLVTTNDLDPTASYLSAEKEISQTVSGVATAETHKTDKTNFLSISNSDFISGIFGKTATDERSIVVSFGGNPNENRSWGGKPWIKDKTLLPNNNNNYTSFATYKPNDAGGYNRKKEYFVRLHAVMLDDVGAKVALDRIILEPSWQIETSSENFQVGYILAEPIKDPIIADNLLNSIIEAGLCDSGCNGPCTRVGRLPVAINGKHKNPDGSYWQCQLIKWNPENRYSIQEMVDVLKLELKSSSQRKTLIRNNDKQADPYQSDVYIPCADENPIIAALKDSGRYKKTLGDGKHDITCPWAHEHTDQIDHGTAYFEPSEAFPTGGFKCLHGHCAERKISTLYDFLGISKAEAQHKPTINVQGGEIPRICDAAEQELSKTGRHFQRSGMIVTVTSNPGAQETTVKPVTQSGLIRDLAGLAIWQRIDKRSNLLAIIDPPEKYARMLWDTTNYPHLPVLNGIAQQPYFRPDDNLMMDAGYDAVTGMFGVFNPKEFSVPDNPSKQQAQAALYELSELLSEFPFNTEHDQSAAICAILTAVVRPSLPQAPMFHVKAPSIASGKSYLCELITAFATPKKGTPHAFPAEDEECRKLLLAELLTVPAVIEFDNLTSDLIPHKSLCTALTSEYMSGRILGQSKTAEVGTRVLFLSSGNNVDPIRDMTRRTVTITLDPSCEMPTARDFKKEPLNEVRINRSRFISLVLTIICAWISAEKPKAECKGIASYAEWSDLCRQPLLWLGLPDPVQSIFESIIEDPDRELLGELLRTWNDRFGGVPTSVKEAIHQLNLHEDLHDAIVVIAGEKDGTINRGRFGWWLKRHSGRIVNGLRMVKDTSTHNAAKWRVESVSSVSSV